MSEATRSRIQSGIEKFSLQGVSRPIVRAFLSEIARHKENLHLYHSIWSTNSERNSGWRKPQFGNYEYARFEVRDWHLELPSSLVDLMEIFSGDLRGRLGIEFPVSHASVGDVPGLAAFVVEQELRSYFEPVIRTGRARGGWIGGQTESRCSVAGDDWPEIAPVLARQECSFRFIHQPIVKFKSSAGARGFFASPGTGVDLDDLSRMGVLESTRADNAFFGAIHSSIIANANYRYTTGCKCNDFSHQMKSDYGSITAEWRKIAAFTIPSVTASDLIDRVAAMASSSHIAAQLH